MKKNLTYSIIPTGILGLLILSACSSSGGGGGATVPTNAVVITAENAESTVTSSVESFDQLDLVLGVDATPTLGLLNALDLTQPLIDTAQATQLNSGVDIVTASDLNFSANCDASGTFTVAGHEDATSSNGTFTATNCDDGLGFIINANFSFSSVFDNIGNYDDTASGSISVNITSISEPITFSFSGLDYAENGNDLTFAAEIYTVSRATFAVDFTTNGISQNGFLVQLLAPIVESNGGENSCPESGTILITGANGSTAEGTYNGDGTMTITANGDVINTSANCIF